MPQVPPSKPLTVDQLELPPGEWQIMDSAQYASEISREGKIYIVNSNAQGLEAGRLRFKAKSAGSVYVAVTWASHNDHHRLLSFDGTDARKDLIQRGWQCLAGLRVKDPSDPENRSYYLLRKETLAGDEVSVRTHPRLRPILFDFGRHAEIVSALPVRPLLHNELTITSGNEVIPELSGVILLKMNHSWIAPGLLLRELPRQALLIAARDELGLATRDATLREDFQPAGRSNKSVVSRYQLGAQLQFACPVAVDGTIYPTLYRQFSAETVQAAPQGTYPFDVYLDDSMPVTGGNNLVSVARSSETLSRTLFIDGLRRAGYDGQPHRWDPTLQIPQTAVEKLRQFEFIPVFAGLRELHAEIKHTGESPARLIALARGYAHLHSATESLWSPAHKAFAARALLYAERLGAKDPQHPELPLLRAYILTLVGQHDLANRELGAPPGTRVPERSTAAEAAMLRAACQFDRKTLRNLADGSEHSTIADYLWLNSFVESAERESRTRAAAAYVNDHPDSLRAYELLADGNTLGYKRYAVDYFAEGWPAALYSQLQEIGDLPRETQRRILDPDDLPESLDEEFEHRADIIASLKANGAPDLDRGEPSWHVLAQLIEDATTLQSYYRARVEGQSLAIDNSQFLSEVLPVIEQHPFGPAVLALSTDQDQSVEALRTLQTRLETGLASQIGPNEFPLLSLLVRRNVELYQPHYSLIWNLDNIYHDLCFSVNDLQRFDNTAFSRLERVSPNSPHVVIVRLRSQWDRVQSHVREWEEKFADDASVMETLGLTYRDKGRTEDAIRCFRTVTQESPTFNAFFYLADLYEQSGDTEQWKAALEQLLKLEETGLEHTRVRVKLARHYLIQGETEKALKFADEAADSAASWAYECAMECHEAVGNSSEAVEYALARVQRYPHTFLDFVECCARTGEGDHERFGKLLAEDTDGAEATGAELHRRALACLTMQQPAMGLKLLEQFAKMDRTVYSPLLLALLADKQGRGKDRDVWLKRLHSATPRLSPDTTGIEQAIDASALATLGQMIEADLAAGGQGNLDLSALQELIAKLPARMPTYVFYFAGQYLGQHGKPNEGETFLRLAATSPHWRLPIVTLACDALHAKSLKIGPRRRQEIDEKK